MLIDKPLVTGTLIRRYKRFLCDVRLATGEEITATCPNPGSMLSVCPEGARVWLVHDPRPTRKYEHTWELVEIAGQPVGINTNRPNALAEEAVRAGTIPALAGYAHLRREVKYGRNSRIDLLLEDDARPPCYVEVKNVTLARKPPLAEFPDSVTARGMKHLEELGDMVEAGARAVMLYIVQRMDCDRFAIAGDIDPRYAEAFQRARQRGVEAMAWGCSLSPGEIVVDRPLDLIG